MLFQFDDFEWDTTKAESNLKKHKISFLQAIAVFSDVFALTEYDHTDEFGEERWLITGVIPGDIVTVVYVERGERFRIISAREATKHERRNYYRAAAKE